MTKSTMKNFAYRAWKDGLDVDQTYQAALAHFEMPKVLHKGYIRQLFKQWEEGQKIADASAELIDETRKQPI